MIVCLVHTSEPPSPLRGDVRRYLYAEDRPCNNVPISTSMSLSLSCFLPLIRFLCLLIQLLCCMFIFEDVLSARQLQHNPCLPVISVCLATGVTNCEGDPYILGDGILSVAINRPLSMLLYGQGSSGYTNLYSGGEWKLLRSHSFFAMIQLYTLK